MRASLLLILVVAACGGDGLRQPNGQLDVGARDVPDGHIQMGCSNPGDCDDNDPCTTDVCGFDAVCRHTAVDCSMLDGLCAAGACDRATGECEMVPHPDGTECMTVASEPGHCTSGVCLAAPQCSVTGAAIGCTVALTTRTGQTSGSGTLSTYACATGETGPEVAYALTVATDRTVTLELDAEEDLDLIVLEGKSCSGQAACMAKSLTPGSGKETITLSARAGERYTVVVEGRAGAAGRFTLTARCAGCSTIQALQCNQTLAGDTSGAKATVGLAGYACADGLGGPEDSYTLVTPFDVEYKLTLSGLANDLDLVVLADSSEGCNPALCRGASVATGTAGETVELSAPANRTHHVVVDSKAAGGAYQLGVSCAPSCRTSEFLTCTSPSDTRRNDDPTRSRNVIDAWGTCAKDLTGPEVVYGFSPPQTGMYTFTLKGLTADLDLLVMESTSAMGCSPLGACVASSLTAGTANETVQIMGEAGKRYWIVVDGRDGAVSPYELTLRGPACAPSCYNATNRLACNWREDRRRTDDPTRAKNAVDAWACAPDTTGPEVVYQLKTTTAGTYTITLDELTADLDLIVLENADMWTCDATVACLASSTNAGTASESVTFTAVAGKSYSVAVDGKNGAVSGYHIRVDSPTCPAPACQVTFEPLSCDVSYRSASGVSDGYSATNMIDTWSCGSGLSGPERVHHFLPNGPGPYTVELIGLQANLDLLVLDAGSSTSCEPTMACMGSSRQPGTTSEKLTFTADPANEYLFVVDGAGGAVSPYVLAVTAGCP